MATKPDYTRKCQQLDVLIDLLERENKRLRELIVHCKDCTFYDSEPDRWCKMHCGEGFDPDAFCSYGKRRATT